MGKVHSLLPCGSPKSQSFTAWGSSQCPDVHPLNQAQLWLRPPGVASACTVYPMLIWKLETKGTSYLLSYSKHIVEGQTYGTNTAIQKGRGQEHAGVTGPWWFWNAARSCVPSFLVRAPSFCLGMTPWGPAPPFSDLFCPLSHPSFS